MPAFVLAFFCVGLLTACGQSATEPLRLSGATMGTSWSAVIVPSATGQPPAQDKLQQEMAAILVTVNNQMSTWQADSELSRFNAHHSADWFPVSPALVRVIQTAQQVSELSGGVYDVTVGPLVNLWGFGAGKTGAPAVPDLAALEAAMQKVGYQKLETRSEPPALRKLHPQLYVDLSSIAKGYGVDQLAAYLDGLGIKNYMVEIGGEIHTRGKSPRGDDWRIAIEKPVALERSVQQGLRLPGGGLATSGDYRNFFTAEGQRYSHTFDALTGQPVKHSLASVSVLAENTMLADAYATMLMAMGEVKGKAFVLEKGIDAYFIWRTDEGFAAFATDGFASALLKPDE